MSEHDVEQAAPEPERPAAAPRAAQGPHDGLLELQRAVGNRAVGRMLAREPLSLRMRQPPAAPSVLDLRIKPYPPPDAEAAIGAWLDANRERVVARRRGGSYHMEDLVAEIRRAVPKADIALDFQIEFTVQGRLGSDAPPYRPRGSKPTPVELPGLGEKLKKLLDGKVIVERDGSYLKVGVTGVEGRVAAGGPATDQTTVKVGPGGVELVAEDKHTTTTITAGWGDAFGFKTKVPGGTVFEAAVGKEGETWSKWSVSISIPIVGKEVVEARPPVDEIVESVNKGYKAATSAIGLLRGGAKPTDDAVKAQFKEVKPAVEKLGKAVEERRGPNVTLKLGVEGAPMTTPGGETRQNTYAGLSLVVEF